MTTVVDTALIPTPSPINNATLVDGHYYGWFTDVIWKLEKIQTEDVLEEVGYQLKFLRSTGAGRVSLYLGTFDNLGVYIKQCTVQEWSIQEAVSFEEEVYTALGFDTANACHVVRQYFQNLHGVDILNHLTFGFPDRWYLSEIPDPLDDISSLVADRYQNTLLLDELGLVLPILDYQYFRIYQIHPDCINYDSDLKFMLVEFGTAPPIYTQEIVDWSYVDFQFVHRGSTPIECVAGFYESNPALDWVDFFQTMLDRAGYNYRQFEFCRVHGQFAMKDKLHVLSWPSLYLVVPIPQILQITSLGQLQVSHLDYVTAYADMGDEKAKVINSILAREGIRDIQVTARDLASPSSSSIL